MLFRSAAPSPAVRTVFVYCAACWILRHLPANLLGDLALIKEDLDFESPLENIKDALEDVAESVAEIAAVTRGFTSKTKPSKVKGGQRSGRRSNHVISKDQKRFRRG